MGSLILWLNIHRTAFIAVLAVVFWTSSYVLYLNPIFWRWRKKGKPHSWSIDLGSKRTGGRLHPKRET
jgi:hypothetical protein